MMHSEMITDFVAKRISSIYSGYFTEAILKRLDNSNSSALNKNMIKKASSDALILTNSQLKEERRQSDIITATGLNLDYLAGVIGAPKRNKMPDNDFRESTLKYLQEAK